MWNQRRRLAILPLLILALVVASCDGGNKFTGNANPAEVSVLLTDAPGDVAAVWIDVERIYLQGLASEGEEDGSGRADLVTEPTGLIELTSLAGTTEELAADVDVEPGTWSQLRFVIRGAVLETEGGDVFTFGGAQHPDGLEATGSLNCPSCAQSGLKVAFPGGLVLDGGENATLVLDFDVTQSFGHQAGQSGMWVMHPVIIAGEMEDQGSISGTVALGTDVEIPECPAGTARSLEDFVPRATATSLTDDEGNALVVSGETDEDGSFVIDPVNADTWDLGFESDIELEDATLVFAADVDPAQVTVADGGTADGVEYTITSATCESGG